MDSYNSDERVRSNCMTDSQYAEHGDESVFLFGAWWSAYSTCLPHLKVSWERRLKPPTATILAVALHEEEAKARVKIRPIE